MPTTNTFTLRVLFETAEKYPISEKHGPPLQSDGVDIECVDTTLAKNFLHLYPLECATGGGSKIVHNPRANTAKPVNSSRGQR